MARRQRKVGGSTETPQSEPGASGMWLIRDAIRCQPLGRVRTNRQACSVSMLHLAAQMAQQADRGWWAEHSTLIVGVVGIVFSGFVGPSVVAFFTARRERSRDKRALIAARRDDLRAVVDEAAGVLGGAVTALRPLLAAEMTGEESPKEPRDFLGALVPLGQRLQLRLPAEHDVIKSYDLARDKLLALADATESQAAFDAAIEQFEASRKVFLDEARNVLQAPVDEGKEL
jgi:hypothetical protein